MTDEVYPCTACGESVDDKFAQYQLANVSDGPTPMCDSCIETNIRNASQLQSAFEAIRDELNPKNRREWDDFSFNEKFLRFLHYHNEGVIRPSYAAGYPDHLNPMGKGASFGSVVRLKAAKLRYEDAPVLTAEG